jgi:hypothetical protein
MIKGGNLRVREEETEESERIERKRKKKIVYQEKDKGSRIGVNEILITVSEKYFLCKIQIEKSTFL